MGVGFILGGFCPGTSLVAVASLKVDGWFFFSAPLWGCLSSVNRSPIQRLLLLLLHGAFHPPRVVGNLHRRHRGPHRPDGVGRLLGG